MGKPTGFVEYQRKPVPYRDPQKRIQDFSEFRQELETVLREQQGGRCMDCGVPFCQSDTGCPVDNLIPEWNDLIYRGKWEEAFYRLMKTNNFPEYTGRVCPAPCEHSCVLGINAPPVTIKDNECAIIDWAYANGLMKPRPPQTRTGKKVAIIGSGPAGLSAADQLNKAGHLVSVFERDNRIGGLLMYGIPNMKLDKSLVQRRNELMEQEGVKFHTQVDVGVSMEAGTLLAEYDAVLIATGSTRPRDLPAKGRNLQGIHFAMDFLKGNTQALLAQQNPSISARDKKVVVIGGGDTGNDCLGTSLRHGCSDIRNFELLPRPPMERGTEYPWPEYARLYKLDYGHEEARARFGDDPREYGILTDEFIEKNGCVQRIKTVRVKWHKEAGSPPRMEKISGSEEYWDADLVFLALGFLGPERTPIEELKVALSPRETVDAPYGTFSTNVPGVFAAGDARRGQSLVVWAIHEGRAAAREIDRHLMKSTLLS